MPTATCENCRFWQPYGRRWLASDSPTMGQCRRKAPVMPQRLGNGDHITTADRVDGIWPLTDDKDFCGEHQPRSARTSDDAAVPARRP